MWHHARSDSHQRSARGSGRRLRRAVGLTIVGVTGAMSLTACGSGGGGTVDDYRSNGITIGYADEKPYDFKNAQGEVTGEAPAVAKEILANLGIKDITWKKVDFDGLIPGLKTGRFDMTTGAASITPDRAEQVDYADPDYCVLEALAVKKGNPLNLSGFKSIADNPKAKLAVESGTTEEKYAKAVGVPESQLVTVSNNSALVASVKTGRADAFALTGITVRDLVERSGGGQLEALDGFNPVVDGEEKISCGGSQFPKDSALLSAYNKQLDKLQKSGEVFSIVKQASPDGDAFGFSQSQFEKAKEHTFEELGNLKG